MSEHPDDRKLTILFETENAKNRFAQAVRERSNQLEGLGIVEIIPSRLTPERVERLRASRGLIQDRGDSPSR